MRTRPRSILALVGALASCFSEPSGDDGAAPGETATTSSGGATSSGSTASIDDAGAGTTGTVATSSGPSSVTTGASADTSSASTSTDTTAGSSGSSGTGSVCGDGIADADEQCDGADLGGATCAAGKVGPPICTAECTVDVSPCCLPTGSMCILNASDCCSGSCGLDLECN
ncbi:MAG: hypothetical protein JNK45_17855 [Myxococcales bacterium]|nr:hypothetical protein [Myxococcales bacterium]